MLLMMDEPTELDVPSLSFDGERAQGRSVVVVGEDEEEEKKKKGCENHEGNREWASRTGFEETSVRGTYPRPGSHDVLRSIEVRSTSEQACGERPIVLACPRRGSTRFIGSDGRRK